MMKCSWPILLILGTTVLLGGCQTRTYTRAPANPKEACEVDQRDYERSLGTLRQYPGALGAWMASHGPNDKLDYGVCYNMRETLKRDAAIADWRKTTNPVCQQHYQSKDAKFAAGLPYKRKSLEGRIAEYNEACSHTMAGTL